MAQNGDPINRKDSFNNHLWCSDVHRGIYEFSPLSPQAFHTNACFVVPKRDFLERC